MNFEIIQRTNKKLKENEEIGKHTWMYQQNQTSKEYIVLPNVFSPQIFLGTQWLTSVMKQKIKKGDQFLEIGCGCGVTSLQIALQGKCEVTACDINEAAVENTKLNRDHYQAKLQVYQSDMFSGLAKKKFDIIYWNFPFHPSDNPYSNVLERAVRDPSYKMLKEFLQSASTYLKENGNLYLGFSLTMGNVEELEKLAKQSFWKVTLDDKMETTSICLFKLNQ